MFFFKMCAFLLLSVPCIKVIYIHCYSMHRVSSYICSFIIKSVPITMLTPSHQRPPLLCGQTFLVNRVALLERDYCTEEKSSGYV